MILGTETGPAPELTLSLAEAQARAIARAPEVALAVDRVQAAAATRVGADLRLPVNPRLSVDARPGLDRGARGSVGTAATLELMFEVGDVPGARVREAERRTRAAEADATVVRLEARLRATALYAGTRLSELRMVAARETIALAERLLAAAGERQAAGAASDIDVTSARVELAERRAQLRDAEATRSRIEGELRLLLALPAQAPLRLTTAMDAGPPALPSTGELLARAGQGHVDLAAIEARLALLASADERLRKEAWPRLGVFGGVDASPQSPVFGLLGLSIELPLFQRAQGPRAVLAAERQAELDRLAQTRARVEHLLRATQAAYRLRREELEVLSKEGIPAAEARLSLVEEGWRAGRFDVFRLVAAAQDLARLRSMRVDVLERLWQERLELERLTGGWTDDRS